MSRRTGFFPFRWPPRSSQPQKHPRYPPDPEADDEDVIEGLGEDLAQLVGDVGWFLGGVVGPPLQSTPAYKAEGSPKF